MIIKICSRLFCIVLLVVLIANCAASYYLVKYSIGVKGDGGERTVSAQAKESGVKALIRSNRTREDEKGEAFHREHSYEEIHLTSSDGKRLYGEFYPALEETNKTVVLVHGYRSQMKYMYSYGAEYYDRGYHVLMVDLRGHGKSEGTYVGMGYLDQKDLIQWIQCLVERNPQAEIVLHGVSMGAATVMMTAGNALPENVKACVEDCGYTSVWEIFKQELSLRFHLPEFPVLYTSSQWAKWSAGYDFKEASALEQIKKCKVPMLFIHGTADDFVPVKMVEELYEAAVCEKDLYIVEGGTHANAKNVDVDAYYAKVFGFLE